MCMSRIARRVAALIALGAIAGLLAIALIRPNHSLGAGDLVSVDSAGNLTYAAGSYYGGSTLVIEMYSPPGSPGTVYARTYVPNYSGSQSSYVGVTGISGCSNISSWPVDYGYNGGPGPGDPRSIVECTGVKNLSINLSGAGPYYGGQGQVVLVAPLQGSAPGSSTPRASISPGPVNATILPPSNSVIQAGTGDVTTELGPSTDLLTSNTPIQRDSVSPVPVIYPRNVDLFGGSGTDEAYWGSGPGVLVTMDGIANDGYTGSSVFPDQNVNVESDVNKLTVAASRGTVDVSGASRPMTVSLDAMNWEGTYGSGPITPTLNSITGSPFADTLFVAEGTIHAGAGDDRLTVGDNACSSPVQASAYGEGGNDTLTGYRVPTSQITLDAGPGTGQQTQLFDLPRSLCSGP